MANDPIKVGFVGCGGISPLYTSIYAGLADLANVVAVADLEESLAETRSRALTQSYVAEAARARMMALDARDRQTADKHAKRAAAAEAAAALKIRKYRSHEDLLEDDEVEAVVILTAPPVRGEPTIAAAETGRHVFIQGPMARSVEEADAMVEAVTRAGIIFHSQCGSRYPRGIALARRAVESGKLGKIGSARVEMNWYRPQGYYRGWHGTWAGEGGGASFLLGRYIIDPFLWVIGSRVAEVFAYSWPALRQIEHESLSQAVVRFDNGATGTIHASVINHAQAVTPLGRIEILGRDASLVVSSDVLPPPVEGLSRDECWQSDTTFGSNDNPAALEGLEALRADVASVPERATEIYQSRLWLESIANGSEPLVPVEVPHHHVEVVRAIYKSAATHQPVVLPLDKSDPFYRFEGHVTAGKVPPS